MARSTFNRKPTFLWQGLLIVLPVVVLAAVGLYSLRQDKILAQHEATERAQAIADDLLPRIWNDLMGASNTAQFQGLRFQIDSEGRLIFPPPFVPVPKPFNSTELPPDNSKAIANYNDAVLLVRREKFQEAAAAFEAIVENFPDAIGETGLELGLLAQWKLLELQNLKTNRSALNSLITPDSFWSNAVYHPTPLTPYFLQLASERDPKVREIWQPLWEEHEVSRELYFAARQHFDVEAGLMLPLLTIQGKKSELGSATSSSANAPIPRLFWFQTPETINALAIRYGDIPNETANGVTLTAHEAQRPLKKGFDRRSIGSKNIITRENRMALDPTGTPRTVTIDNQEAILSKTRAKPIFEATKGRNIPNLEAVQGPTSSASNSLVIPPTKFWFICRLEPEIGTQVTTLVNAMQIPEYFGVGVELAGKKLTWNAPDLRIWQYFHYGGKTGGERKELQQNLVTKEAEVATNVLASATRTEAGVEQLRINIYVTSPTTLFHNQRTRTFWFGALIAVSAVAALIGLLTAWRAFNRQQQLSEMKSNFVSSVSHELRAPIASVRLMAESLERGKISGEQKQSEYFHFIVQECRRLTSLIENVLDFSRIEQGRKQYEFEPTDLVALTQQTVKLMDNPAQEKGVRLVFDLSNIQHPTSNIELNVDGRAIQQALVNLIDNAIKHSPKGGTVTVGLDVGGPKSEAGGQSSMDIELLDATRNTQDGIDKPSLNPQPSTLKLFVEDHGEGIPPEEHEKIFERFYRLGSELRRETQGVGIGLSIVKHIVEAHDGRVLVRSAVGQGSRFTIELPLK